MNVAFFSIAGMLAMLFRWTSFSYPCDVTFFLPTLPMRTTSPVSSIVKLLPSMLFFIQERAESRVSSYCPAYSESEMLGASISFWMRARFSQSPNHFLNARVRTVTHCFGVSFVSCPFGAFSHVPFAFAERSISARSGASFARALHAFPM